MSTAIAGIVGTGFARHTSEVFGPVLTLQRFASDDEAIALANGTDYGLGGVCYGATEHATAVAQRVRTGFIWITPSGSAISWHLSAASNARASGAKAATGASSFFAT